jgi:hypothetical protein
LQKSKDDQSKVISDDKSGDETRSNNKPSGWKYPVIKVEYGELDEDTRQAVYDDTAHINLQRGLISPRVAQSSVCGIP